MSNQLYLSVGGKLLSSPVSLAEDGGDVWDFGWVPPALRDDQQNETHEQVEQSVSPASVLSTSNDDVDYANLTKFWNHPEVVSALGFAYNGTHQLTGSCVGAGMGNAANTLNFIEVLLQGDPEKLFLCFYPYHYGLGRMEGGMRGRGEGSMGSSQAAAVKKYGVMDNALYSLPKPTSTSDGIVWGSAVEMKWSDGAAVPAEVLAEGKKHIISDVAKINNHDEARRALVGGKPITCASMYAHNGGRVQGEGKDACLLASKSGSWSHQMSILAYWLHSKFGPLFWLMNQWGLNAHGTCPTGMPRGGVWITGADVDWICQRGGETYAYAGHSGWDSGKIDWSRI